MRLNMPTRRLNGCFWRNAASSVTAVSARRCVWMAIAGVLVIVARTAGAVEFEARDYGTTFFDPLVRFTNLTVVARDAKTATIRVDVTWENSWRQEYSHDAAWVFFKVRANAGAEWQHVRLAADRVLNPVGYGQTKSLPPPPKKESRLRYYLPGRPDDGKPGGAERSREFFARELIDTRLEFLVPRGEDGFTGVFLQRAGSGAGNVMARGITVLWDLSAAKDITDPAKAQVRAIGIQMVYVAEGPFYLGTGGEESYAFLEYGEGQSQARPYRVTSAGAIPTGRQLGRLWARDGAEPEDGGEIPANFPNGYGAFYCMRQPITPRRYAEFLETLTPAQSDERYLREGEKVSWAVTRSGKAPKYTYTWHCGGPRAGSGMHRLSWADGAAWAAWAGLRPITELEIEKVVRGPREPMPEEGGPSYWDVMGFNTIQWNSIKGWELSGDRAVTVGNAKGRGFKGTHGDGTLTLPPDWPQADAVGAGLRCQGLEGAPASYRLHAATVVPERAHRFFRAVRTAPDVVEK